MIGNGSRTPPFVNPRLLPSVIRILLARKWMSTTMKLLFRNSPFIPLFSLSPSFTDITSGYSSGLSLFSCTLPVVYYLYNSRAKPGSVIEPYCKTQQIPLPPEYNILLCLSIYNGWSLSLNVSRFIKEFTIKEINCEFYANHQALITRRRWSVVYTAIINYSLFNCLFTLFNRHKRKYWYVQECKHITLQPKCENTINLGK